MAKPSIHDLAKTTLYLSGKLSQEKLAQSLALYLQQESRTSDLEAIMREVSFLRQKQSGVVEVDTISAHPISLSVKKQIKKIFGEEVIINEEIDKKVIGGVRIETNDQILDLTVRNRLNKLKSLRGV